MLEERFEWDPSKAAANFRKHRVSLEEGTTVFDDRNVLVNYDSKHSLQEDRRSATGISERGRLVAGLTRFEVREFA